MSAGHVPCPKCREYGRDRSGNNMYVYEDGHSYCFSCGFKQRPSLERQLHVVEADKPTTMGLPQDAGKTIPSMALTWLAKYGILQQEIIDFDVMWSDSLNWLIFPVFGDEHKETLLTFQARNFGNHGKKYYTRGSVGAILNYYDQKGSRQPEDTLIIVEDMVSAIKISRQFVVMPLLGSFLSTDRALRLNRFFDKLVFWLDYDKAESAMKQALRMKVYAFKTSVIITREDPKAYSDEEISDFVDGTSIDRVLSKPILGENAACG